MIFNSAYELLRKCFTDFENAYLNRSLSHLFDPINLIFSSSSALDKPINHADIETYLKGVQSQLQTLQYDTFNSSALLSLDSAANSKHAGLMSSGYSSAFSDKVVGNIAKSIQMFSNKGEQLLNGLNAEFQSSVNSSGQPGGSSSSQSTKNASNIFLNSNLTTGLPYQIQMKNLDYINVTHDMFEQLKKQFELEKLTQKHDDKLNSALKSLLVFEENSLKPFIASASDCILAIILTMHQEDYTYASSSSLYIKELQQVLQRICRDYLQQYSCKTILSGYMNQLGSRCIELFIRHSSILRPMSETCRTRMINDSHHIENIIQTQLLVKLTDLGMSYKQLKAFRHLLETKSPYDASSTAGSSLGSDVADEVHYAGVIEQQLPYNSLLHYLFSYAPNEMKSPHQNLDWSPARYSEWLEKHVNEKERLLAVKACLDAYVNLVKQRKETKFAPLYPLMTRLLEKGLQACASS